jgi:hypothetical protein
MKSGPLIKQRNIKGYMLIHVHLYALDSLVLNGRHDQLHTPATLHQEQFVLRIFLGFKTSVIPCLTFKLTWTLFLGPSLSFLSWPIIANINITNSRRIRGLLEDAEALKQTKRTQWPQSASELHRPSDRCLSAKLVSTFAEVSRSQRGGSPAVVNSVS